MFKTVRTPHGTGGGGGNPTAELEYTILPQTDDRSPSSASSGDDDDDDDKPTARPGRHHQCLDYKQRHHQQQTQQQDHRQHYQCQHRRHGHRDAAAAVSTRRTVIVIVAVLVFGCGVVAAAVLVPILLAARLVSTPASARLQTFAVAASGVIHSERGDYVQLLPVRHAPPGTVIEFEPPPLSERQRQATAVADGRRKKRSLRRPWRRRLSWRTVGLHRRRFWTGSAAGFRSLHFRARQ